MQDTFLSHDFDLKVKSLFLEIHGAFARKTHGFGPARAVAGRARKAGEIGCYLFAGRHGAAPASERPMRAARSRAGRKENINRHYDILIRPNVSL